MKDLQVAFQGEPGAYSEQAALEYFGADTVTVPCHSFDDVFAFANQGGSRRGLIPIENSLAGSIHRNYDLLLRNDLHIVGEYHLRVSHCLLALPGARISELRRAHSHPQALAQCEASLDRLGLERVAEADTAGSARLVKEWGDPQAAAIASRRAAQVYGLNVLAEHLEDDPANYTRFLAVSTKPLEAGEPVSGEYKTSIVFSLVNAPGALYRALSVFALRGIDLTKMESRPLPGHLWEYMFYIDFAGHAAEPACARALENLREWATFLRILGSYPRHRLENPDGETGSG